MKIVVQSQGNEWLTRPSSAGQRFRHRTHNIPSLRIPVISIQDALHVFENWGEVYIFHNLCFLAMGLGFEVANQFYNLLYVHWFSFLVLNYLCLESETLMKFISEVCLICWWFHELSKDGGARLVIFWWWRRYNPK
jgi:hypothetical protein